MQADHFSTALTIRWSWVMRSSSPSSFSTSAESVAAPPNEASLACFVQPPSSLKSPESTASANVTPGLSPPSARSYAARSAAERLLRMRSLGSDCWLPLPYSVVIPRPNCLVKSSSLIRALPVSACCCANGSTGTYSNPWAVMQSRIWFSTRLWISLAPSPPNPSCVLQLRGRLGATCRHHRKRRCRPLQSP